MRVDPQRLIRLAVLIRHGTFHRAASHLGVTQPALSQSIAQMEREVGFKLIERTPHGVEPTIYGRLLFEHAKSIDRELSMATRHLQELASGHKGVIKVGVSTGAAASVVALAVCRLLKSNPGIDTQLVEETAVTSLLSQLHDRSLDMLICQRPNEIELKGTRSLSLFEAKRAAWIRAAHPLGGDVTLRELSAYSFVCPQQEMGALFGFQQIFSAVGLDLPNVLMCNSIYMAKDIVLNSDAFAFFSDLSVISERKLGLLKSVELETPTHYWMQLILREEQLLSLLMKSLVGNVMTICKEMGIAGHADATGFRAAPGVSNTKSADRSGEGQRSRGPTAR